MQSNRLRLGAGFAAMTCLGLLLTFSGYGQARGAGDSSWGFAPTNLDKTCKPCDDFYEFAMGGWLKANPIPAEYATWGTFTQLRDTNLTAMRTILDAATNSNAPAGSNEQKIVAFYASCMDTSAIETAGLKPIEGELAAVNGITDRKSLDATIAHLQREGSNAVFRFGSGQDIKDSSRIIAIVSQGGLGMPDRDYYLRDDTKSEQLREDYEKHIAKMMELAGDPADKAEGYAQTIRCIGTKRTMKPRQSWELKQRWRRPRRRAWNCAIQRRITT